MGRTFILITGRSTPQGRTIHFGKDAKEYVDVVSTLEMNETDMAGLGLGEGDAVSLASRHGHAVLHCKKGNLPPGLVFAAYGSFINALIGPDTQGTGMPDSKGIEIEVEKHAGH